VANALPAVLEIRASGVQGLAQIAAAMNNRGVDNEERCGGGNLR